VRVAVAVEVFDGVKVAVAVFVAVRVYVAVNVDVFVGVLVLVAVYDAVIVGVIVAVFVFDGVTEVVGVRVAVMVGKTVALAEIVTTQLLASTSVEPLKSPGPIPNELRLPVSPSKSNQTGMPIEFAGTRISLTQPARDGETRTVGGVVSLPCHIRSDTLPGWLS
jgi:hypothetical protein